MSEFVSNPPIWACPVYPSLSSGNADLQTFSPSIDNALAFVSCFIIIFLKVTGISYQDYYQGGVYLNNLIVPSTVALGIPLYKSFHLMKHHARSILFGSLLAVVVNTSFTALVAKSLAWTFPSHFSLSQVSDNRHGSGNYRKIARFDDCDLGGCSGDWDFNQCNRPNPFEVVENRRSSSCWSFPWRNRSCCRNRNSISIWLCSRSHGWFGYRCYRYSLCLCQPYRSQFDIELILFENLFKPRQLPSATSKQYF